MKTTDPEVWIQAQLTAHHLIKTNAWRATSEAADVLALYFAILSPGIVRKVKEIQKQINKNTSPANLTVSTSLTSKWDWLPATVAWRISQFTIHSQHLPAFGWWLMVISHPDSHLKGAAPFSNSPKQSAAKFSIMRLFIWDNKAPNRIKLIHLIQPNFVD